MNEKQKVRTIVLIVDVLVVRIIVTLQMILICLSNSMVEVLESHNVFQQTRERMTKCTRIILMMKLLITPRLIPTMDNIFKEISH